MTESDIAKQLLVIKEQNDKIIQTTNHLSNKMDEFNNRFVQLEQRVDTIERDQDCFDAEINDMKVEMNNMRQTQLQLGSSAKKFML